jgi:hypothetical protein
VEARPRCYVGSRCDRQRCSWREQQPSPVTAPEDQGILRERLSLWSTVRHFGRICGSLVDAFALIRVECFPQQAMAADVQDESMAVRGGQRQTVAVVRSMAPRSVDARSVRRPPPSNGTSHLPKMRSCGCLLRIRIVRAIQPVPSCVLIAKIRPVTRELVYSLADCGRLRWLHGQRRSRRCADRGCPRGGVGDATEDRGCLPVG